MLPRRLKRPFLSHGQRPIKPDEPQGRGDVGGQGPRSARAAPAHRRAATKRLTKRPQARAPGDRAANTPPMPAREPGYRTVRPGTSSASSSRFEAHFSARSVMVRTLTISTGRCRSPGERRDDGRRMTGHRSVHRQHRRPLQLFRTEPRRRKIASDADVKGGLGGCHTVRAATPAIKSRVSPTPSTR